MGEKIIRFHFYSIKAIDSLRLFVMNMHIERQTSSQPCSLVEEIKTRLEAAKFLVDKNHGMGMGGRTQPRAEDFDDLSDAIIRDITRHDGKEVYNLTVVIDRHVQPSMLRVSFSWFPYY